MKTLHIDLSEIRRRARSSVAYGERQLYPGDLPKVFSLLNVALASEVTCHLIFRRHHYIAFGLSATQAMPFLTNAEAASAAGDKLAKRIVELGGKPDFCPDSLLLHSIVEYSAAAEVRRMLEDELSAERDVIALYRGAIPVLSHDPTTRRLLEGILATKEALAESLRLLLFGPEPPDPDSSSQIEERVGNVVSLAGRAA